MSFSGTKGGFEGTGSPMSAQSGSKVAGKTRGGQAKPCGDGPIPADARMSCTRLLDDSRMIALGSEQPRKSTEVQTTNNRKARMTVSPPVHVLRPFRC